MVELMGIGHTFINNNILYINYICYMCSAVSSFIHVSDYYRISLRHIASERLHESEAMLILASPCRTSMYKDA